jgi:hypothetical protein
MKSCSHATYVCTYTLYHEISVSFQEEEQKRQKVKERNSMVIVFYILYNNAWIEVIPEH